MSKITVDTSQLDKFVARIDKYPTHVHKGVTDAVKTSTFNVQKYAKANLTANCSVDTGYLRNSINTKVSTWEGVVSTNVAYAKIVEDGSKPHIIRPKNKKFLYWKGASHPVKQVRHPGSKGKPYMAPALEKEFPNFIKQLEKAVELP